MMVIARAVVVLLALAVPSLVFGHGLKHSSEAGRFIDVAYEAPDVTLVDSSGKPRVVGDLLEGHRVVISFFYANCKDICPVTNMTMAQLAKSAFSLDGKPARLLSITVDPERDTPAVIRDMSEAFGEHPDWVWLTGASADVRKFTHGLGMRYDRPEDHGVLFIVGDADSGHFISTSGLANADDLLRELEAIGD